MERKSSSTSSSSVKCKETTTITPNTFNFARLETKNLVLNTVPTNGKIGSGSVDVVSCPLCADNTILFFGKESLTTGSSLEKVQVSSNLFRVMWKELANSDCTLTHPSDRFAEFDCESTITGTSSLVDFSFMNLAVGCDGECVVAWSELSQHTFSSLVFKGTPTALHFAVPIRTNTLRVDLPLCGSFSVGERVDVVLKDGDVGHELNVTLERDAVVSVVDDGNNTIEPTQRKLFLFKGEVKGAAPHIHEAVCKSGARYVAFTAARDVGCVCWFGERMSGGHEENWCGEEFETGVREAVLVFDTAERFSTGGFVFAQESVVFATQQESVRVAVKELEAPRSLAVGENVLLEAETIRVKERLTVAVLASEHTRVVSDEGDAHVEIGELRGSLGVGGIELRVTRCERETRISTEGRTSVHLECSGTLIPREGSTLVVDGGVGAINSTERFVLSTLAAPTLTAHKMHAVFRDASAAVVLGEGEMAFRAEENTSVVVVGKHRFTNKKEGEEKQIVFDEKGNCNGLAQEEERTDTKHSTSERKERHALSATAMLLLGVSVLLRGRQRLRGVLRRRMGCALSVPKGCLERREGAERVEKERGGVQTRQKRFSATRCLCFQRGSALLEKEASPHQHTTIL